jgi:hypothetical protein
MFFWDKKRHFAFNKLIVQSARGGLNNELVKMPLINIFNFKCRLLHFTPPKIQVKPPLGAQNLWINGSCAPQQQKSAF